MLTWYYDDNGLESGEERLWLNGNPSMFDNAVAGPGVLNIENMHNILSYEGLFLSYMGAGYTGSGSYTYDNYDRLNYYWNSWRGFEYRY